MAASFTELFDGVKCFSATMAAEREKLGDYITEWVNGNKDAVKIVHTVVSQSSDQAFHCITVVVFYTGVEKFKQAPLYNKRERT